MFEKFKSKNTKTAGVKRFWSSETGSSYPATNTGITHYIDDLKEWSSESSIPSGRIRSFLVDFLASGKLVGAYSIGWHGVEFYDTLEIAVNHPKGRTLAEVTYRGKYSA